MNVLFLIVTIYASKIIRGMNPDQPYSFFPLHGNCTFRLLSSKSVADVPVRGRGSWCAVADGLEPRLQIT